MFSLFQVYHFIQHFIDHSDTVFLQPEEALKIYHEAERTSPEDTALVMKISRAFGKAHEYDKVKH